MQRMRIAPAVLYISAALLVLSVIAVGVADASRSLAVAWIALSLVLRGVVGLFTGIALASTLVLIRAADTLKYQASRTRGARLALPPCPSGGRLLRGAPEASAPG
jgi:hypothetical protein